MKLFFSIFLLFLPFVAYSQNFAGNTVQGGNITFDCSHKFGTYVRLYNQQFGVSHGDSTTFKGNDCLRGLLSESATTNIRSALKQVFSSSRASQLLQEKRIYIHFSVTPQGSITHISYRIHKDTFVTPIEFANLENVLRSKILPLDNGSLCVQLPSLGCQYIVDFSKLY